MKKNVTN